jgi:hypothetical protein
LAQSLRRIERGLRSGHENGEWVDVAAEGWSSSKLRLHKGCSAAYEGVDYEFAGLREGVDGRPCEGWSEPSGVPIKIMRVATDWALIESRFSQHRQSARV